MKAHRTKGYAMRLVHGNDEEQFSKLVDYKAELERTNPGSNIVIDYDVLTFKKMYVCLDALKKGFKNGCRRVVGVDGCFLKAIPGWQLLTAVGVDANEQMFPICWAVVEKECIETWEWFMALVAEDLEISPIEHWTFMSDRKKGLIHVMNSMFPYAEHRYCIRHMYNNFSDKFSRAKVLKDLFWAAAKTTNQHEHKRQMELLELAGAAHVKGGQSPHQWLSLKPCTEWSKAFFQTHTKCSMSLNNHCEAFNRAILEARDLPILSCLEDIRCMMMKKLHVMRRWFRRLDPTAVCPAQIQKLNKSKELAVNCFPTFNGDRQFEVECGSRRFVVDMRLMTCACGRWQLTGIPCSHAISCIRYNRERPEMYVHPSLKVEAALRSYAYAIHPLNDSSQWIRSDGPRIRPPTLPRKTSGPRQKKRRREPGELLQQKKNKRGQDITTMNRTGMPMRCGFCNEEGHNKRGCKKNKGADGGQPQAPETGEINLNINPDDEGAREPIDLNTSVFMEDESGSPRAGTSASGFTFIPNLSHSRSKLGVHRGRGCGRN